MRITAVRVLELHGTMPTDGPFWEERLVRPIDIYPEYRVRDDFEGGVQIDPGHFSLVQYFARIEPDAGIIGIAGPLPELVAAFVAKRLRPILLGRTRSRTRSCGTRCTASWCTAARATRCWRSAPSIARCGTSKGAGSASRCIA